MYKQVRMKGVDRISDLPDSLLTHILSFISTEEAAVTSILSTRWRYVFTLLPNLDFELRKEGLKMKSCTVESFISFVDRMLLVHNATNIDELSLGCVKEVGSRPICRWISAANRRGIKHLDLDIERTKYSKTWIRAVFACTTLVTLKLKVESIFDVPKGFHCPNLKTLHLEWVEFSNDDTVKSLLSGCSSLVDMKIESCSMRNITNFSISHLLLKRLTLYYNIFHINSWLIIDAPNLAYFRFCSSQITGSSVENLPSLVKAEIDIQWAGLQTDATSLFRGMCNVRSLCLSTESLKLLSRCQPLPVFATLVELEIRGCRHWSVVEGFESLLSISPQLEKLSLPQDIFCSFPSCLLFKIKAIEITNFKDHEDCGEKLKYIVKNGGTLENITVRAPFSSKEGKLEVFKVL